MIVTQHARERWVERVDPTASFAEAARAILSYRRALAAAELLAGPGEIYIRLPNRHRIVCRGDAVLTVL